MENSYNVVYFHILLFFTILTIRPHYAPLHPLFLIRFDFSLESLHFILIGIGFICNHYQNAFQCYARSFHSLLGNRFLEEDTGMNE